MPDGELDVGLDGLGEQAVGDDGADGFAAHGEGGGGRGEQQGEGSGQELGQLQEDMAFTQARCKRLDAQLQKLTAQIAHRIGML